jgi:hypothetical protein
MVKFIIKNRSDVKNAFFPGKSAVLISITDPDKDHCIPSGQYRDVLCVKFSDADRASDGIQLISTDTAERVIRFVVKNLDVDFCVVNCEAGISRSAGCAAALSKIFTGDDSELVRAKPFFNRTVYRTILDTWQVRFDDTKSPDTIYTDHCPDCGSLIVNGDGWGDVKCSNEKCGYWICY